MENKAIAASTAFMYAACLQHHVPEVSHVTGFGSGLGTPGVGSASQHVASSTILLLWLGSGRQKDVVPLLLWGRPGR